MLNKTMIVFSSLLITLFFSYPSFAQPHPNGHELIQDAHQAGARIDIEEDQDEVYDAVQQGLVKPFSELYAQVESDLKGRIIKVELEEDDNEWTYELKLVHDNNVIKVEYDAATLEIMEIKGRNIRNAIKK